MKTIRKILVIAIIALFFLPFSQLMAQPGNPPGGPGTNDDPIGGNAPIGGGSLLLIGLAAAYGSKKVFGLRKNKEEEEN